jgi:hypothetical protein
MNTDAPVPAKVLLIDLENCPGQINDLLSKLGDYAQVVICYAQSGAKVPLDWLVPLSEAIASQRLKVIKMAHVGKNAADFGLCFFAGALMQQFPPDTDFTVVSEDADLDHAVQLLIGEGRTARRVGRPEDRPGTLVATVTAALSLTDEVRTVASYCAMLLAHPDNRPGGEMSLLNSLRSHFRQSQSLAEQAFQQLVARGAIRISSGRVIYVESGVIALVGS